MPIAPRTGPMQRAAPAERHPDDEFGAEHEAGVLGRDHAGASANRKPAIPATPASATVRDDLDARRVECRDRRSGLRSRGSRPAAPASAADEHPGRHGHERPGRRPQTRTSRQARAAEVSKPTRPLLDPVKRPPEKTTCVDHDRQHERDHRGIERRRAVIEGEPADDEAEHHRQRRWRAASASAISAGAEPRCVKTSAAA